MSFTQSLFVSFGVSVLLLFFPLRVPIKRQLDRRSFLNMIHFDWRIWCDPRKQNTKKKIFLAPSPSCSSFGMSDAPCIVSQTNIQWQKNSKYFSPKNSRNRHVRSQVSSLTDELVNEQNCQAKTGTAWTVGASLKKKKTPHRIRGNQNSKKSTFGLLTFSNSLFFGLYVSMCLL